MTHQSFNGIDKSWIIPFQKDREKVLYIAWPAVGQTAKYVIRLILPKCLKSFSRNRLMGRRL
jgi:hypothetical protein